MWWRCVIVVSACLDAISSQPLTQQVSDARAPIECCPCPGSERAALDTVGFSSQPTESDLIDRETDVDDCPCRVRDADSSGAPSIFLPRVLHPLQPDVKTGETYEDVKPLLHPEVDLASSVLETLREATEEEYQEALERDAARNTARASEDDTSLQTTDSGNTDIINIIVNPKAGEEEDIMISEASHVQESQCAHPLGSSRNDFGQVRLSTPLLHSKGLPRMPNFESKIVSPRPFDVHNSASNVDERVVTANRGLEGFNLKSSTSKVSEFLERAKFKLSGTSNIGGTKNFTSSKAPNFRFDSLVKKKNERTGLKVIEKKLRSPVNSHNFPKINLSRGKTTILDSMSETDSNTSPSIVHEQLSKTLNQEPEKNNLKSLLAKNIKERPTHLKKLIKLKDFELVTNKPLKTKINRPSLKIKPFSQVIEDSNKPRLTEFSCGQERSSETSVNNITQNSEPTVNDTDLSPSENHPSFIDYERNTSEEHTPDDTDSTPLSKIEDETGAIVIDIGNRSEEVFDEFEDFILDDENENFNKHKKEQESSETKTVLTSKEIIINSNEIEGIDSVELPREDNLLHESDDSLVDASNNNFYFISQINDHSIELGDKEAENRSEINEEIAEVKSSENEDNPTLKEKMLQKLEELKDDIVHIKNSRETNLKSSETKDDEKQEKNAEKLRSVDTQIDSTNTHVTPQEFITRNLKDQSSSFGGLEVNSKNLPNTPSSLQEWNASIKPSANIKDNNDENTDMNPSGSSIETIILDSVSLPSEPDENSNISDSNLQNDSTNQDNLNDQSNNSENSLEKTCIADFDSKVKNNVENSNPNEMSSQASESILNVVPQPTERQSIVVQPSSLFGDNNLFRNLPDLLNLNTHVPTLEEIRSGLSGILGIGAKGANDEDEISAEFQSSEDCSSAMSTDASTKNSKSILPNLKPLEDINLDIFQLTPKSQKDVFQSRAPGLNLNSYKTKLALPQNLGLRPLRLESSLGNNGNLLGATLTFGPDRIGSAKSKMSRTSSLLGTRNPTLRSSLPNLPNFDGIKTTMRARTEDLLSSHLPKAVPSHTIQKVNQLTSNLRSHTENTVKNIQQTLASSLSESRVKDIPLRGKFAKPSHEDLLEKLSTAREDMSDKLKALQIDLADRLSSIHETIVEKTTLPTLQLPLFTPIYRDSNTKLRTRSKNYSKQKASNSNVRTSKGNFNTRSSVSRGTDETKVRPFKITKAASTLTPKTVEVPKLLTTSSKPPFVKPLQRDTNVKLKDSRPLASSITLDQKSISENNVRPSKNNPSLQKKPSIRQQFSSQRTTSRTPSTKESFRNRANLHDSRGYASELQPSLLPLPINSAVKDTDSTNTKQTKIAHSRSKPLFAYQNLGIPTQISTPATKLRSDQISKSSIHKPLSKVTSSPLLSKMRESRLNRNFSQADIHLNSDGMARSATENRAIEVKQEPLKENVKYRCRMVCVKEPIK